MICWESLPGSPAFLSPLCSQVVRGRLAVVFSPFLSLGPSRLGSLMGLLLLSAVTVRLSLLTIRVPLLLCEKMCKICRSADVPTSEAAYRSVRTGVCTPRGSAHARPLTTTTTTTTGRADHIPSHLWRGRSLLALEAVRGISGGASLSTLGGEGTHWKAHLQHPPCSAHRFLP